MLTTLCLLALALVVIGACATPLDALRAKTEDLGPKLYLRASWRDPWLNVIPRDTYPEGAGYERSAFVVGRSEPTTDEETWASIAAIAENNTSGACAITYGSVGVGHKENKYKPEMKGLHGPLVCQDDLVMYWLSRDFWERYFQALQKRSVKTITHRLGNVYMNYVPRAAANANFHFVAGDFATQPSPANVDLTALDAGSANLPTSELMQEMLDDTARELIEEGANEGDTNGWITMGSDGPIFPILIGQDASKRILLNNSELANQYALAFQGYGDANPVLQRLGASRVVKNFRHVITPFPPRWSYDSNTDTFTRVPTFVNSSNATYATKGTVAIVNPDWRDASIAAYEGAIVMNPLVMTEEVVRPINTAPSMSWQAQNYFGEWKFVTGNDAVLGFDDCAGIADPTTTSANASRQSVVNITVELSIV